MIRPLLRQLLKAACLVLPAAVAFSQNVGNNLDYTRASLKAQKRAIIGGSVAMSEREASAFWPIHDAYERERDRIDDREAKLIEEYLASGAQPSDARARTMLDEVVGLGEERLALKKRYVKTLRRRALPEAGHAVLPDRLQARRAAGGRPGQGDPHREVRASQNHWICHAAESMSKSPPIRVMTPDAQASLTDCRFATGSDSVAARRELR